MVGNDGIPFVVNYEFPVRGFHYNEEKIYSIWDLFLNQNKSALMALGVNQHFTPDVAETHLTMIEAVVAYTPR